ncbi:MAG: HD domain-containing phosphohydrolase [Planctomycetaceae bacterium]
MRTTSQNTLNDSNDRLLLPGEIRLSELVAALSTALDLTEGQPEGHAARSCLIGMHLARQLGLADNDLGALFYALLLKDLGCSSNAAKMCWLFGTDDRVVKRDMKSIDWTRAVAKFRFAAQHAAVGGSPLQKALQFVVMAREGEAGARKLVETRCYRGAEIARQLGFPEATARAIESLDEHWNGRGQPAGLKGEEIPLFSRIMGIAQTTEVFHASFGRKAAQEMVRERRGTWFDPQLADLLLAAGDELWTTLENANYASAVAACEPVDQVQNVSEDQLDIVAAAFASVVDAKSPWTHKHSERVAEIAREMARVMGLSPERCRDIHRAGLLHDLGKLGVSNMVLDKPGKPTDAEFHQIRLHPDFSKQILDRIPTFRKLADVASAHHERLDGRGYHRQLPGAEMTLESRILAVADVYEALTAKRPYRDGLPLEKVREIMEQGLGTAFCPMAYSALMTWLDKTTFTPRVEAQLEAIETLHQSMAKAPTA